MKEKFWLCWTIIMWLCPLAYIRDYYFAETGVQWAEEEHLWFIAFVIMTYIKYYIAGKRPWEL